MLVRSKPNGHLIGEAHVNDDIRIVVKFVNTATGIVDECQYSPAAVDAFRADWEVL